jgi:superfamily I DNA/RNA helicase
VLASAAPDEQPPESVREEGVSPRAVRGLGQVRPVVQEELAEMGDAGRLAVIAPGALVAGLALELPEAVPGDRAEVLDSPVALLTVGQAKGLEFDRVVLVDPAGILDQSPAGAHDLYVAITRATHRLTLIHEAPLPQLLRKARAQKAAPGC